jgi:hypothetical protein
MKVDLMILLLKLLNKSKINIICNRFLIPIRKVSKLILDSSNNTLNNSKKKISLTLKKKFINDKENYYLNHNEKVKLNNVNDSFNAETDTSNNINYDINKCYSSQDDNIVEKINNEQSNLQILSLLKYNL